MFFPNSLFFFDSASKVVALPSQSISSGTALSASYSHTASYAVNASTASYALDTPASLSSSHALLADTASLVEFSGVTDNYFPQWKSNRLTPTSSISIAEGSLININNVDIFDAITCRVLYFHFDYTTNKIAGIN